MNLSTALYNKYLIWKKEKKIFFFLFLFSLFFTQRYKAALTIKSILKCKAFQSYQDWNAFSKIIVPYSVAISSIKYNFTCIVLPLYYRELNEFLAQIMWEPQACECLTCLLWNTILHNTDRDALLLQDLGDIFKRIWWIWRTHSATQSLAIF